MRDGASCSTINEEERSPGGKSECSLADGEIDGGPKKRGNASTRTRRRTMGLRLTELPWVGRRRVERRETAGEGEICRDGERLWRVLLPLDSQSSIARRRGERRTEREEEYVERKSEAQEDD